MVHPRLLWCALILAACCVGCRAPSRDVVTEVLPVFGHRNWMVVADSAYPKQSSPGIRTVYVGGDQVDVVRGVLEAIDRAPHVRARIAIDSELDHVTGEFAPGIDAYRRSLDALLAGRDVTRAPHEAMLSRLADTAAKFDVLIVKTDMALPYTSVFIELDCGYWSAESEARLRQGIR